MIHGVNDLAGGQELETSVLKKEASEEQDWMMNGDKSELEKMTNSNHDLFMALAKHSPFSKYKNPVTVFENLCNLLTTKNRIKDQKGTNQEKFKEVVLKTWNKWKGSNKYPVLELYQDLVKEKSKLPKPSSMKQLNFVDFLKRKKIQEENLKENGKQAENNQATADSLEMASVSTDESNQAKADPIEVASVSTDESDKTLFDLATTIGERKIPLSIRDLKDNKLLANEAILYTREVKIFTPLKLELGRIQKYKIPNSSFSSSLAEADSNIAEVNRLLNEGKVFRIFINLFIIYLQVRCNADSLRM